jgi:hypothetical protein
MAKFFIVDPRERKITPIQGDTNLGFRSTLITPLKNGTWLFSEGKANNTEVGFRYDGAGLFLGRSLLMCDNDDCQMKNFEDVISYVD